MNQLLLLLGYSELHSLLPLLILFIRDESDTTRDPSTLQVLLYEIDASSAELSPECLHLRCLSLLHLGFLLLKLQLYTIYVSESFTLSFSLALMISSSLLDLAALLMLDATPPAPMTTSVAGLSSTGDYCLTDIFSMIKNLSINTETLTCIL